LWAKDYVSRIARHRAELRAETGRLDWLFSVHTTNHSAADLLLFLHNGMMVNKATPRASIDLAGRSA
jgi:hypothetical protein